MCITRPWLPVEIPLATTPTCTSRFDHAALGLTLPLHDSPNHDRSFLNALPLIVFSPSVAVIRPSSPTLVYLCTPSTSTLLLRTLTLLLQHSTLTARHASPPPIRDTGSTQRTLPILCCNEQTSRAPRDPSIAGSTRHFDSVFVVDVQCSLLAGRASSLVDRPLNH